MTLCGSTKIGGTLFDPKTQSNSHAPKRRLCKTTAEQVDIPQEFYPASIKLSTTVCGTQCIHYALENNLYVANCTKCTNPSFYQKG